MAGDKIMDDLKDRESVIREKFQITLPGWIRESAGLRIGDVLLWEYDEVTGTMTAIPKPKSFTEALAGLGAHLWKGGVEELRRERDSEWGL